MKIKGVMDLKIKKFNYNSKNISRNFFWRCCGQCGVSSVSDSSLIRLILLKIYRPLPI